MLIRGYPISIEIQKNVLLFFEECGADIFVCHSLFNTITTTLYPRRKKEHIIELRKQLKPGVYDFEFYPNSITIPCVPGRSEKWLMEGILHEFKHWLQYTHEKVRLKDLTNYWKDGKIDTVLYKENIYEQAATRFQKNTKLYNKLKTIKSSLNHTEPVVSSVQHEVQIF